MTGAACPPSRSARPRLRDDTARDVLVQRWLPLVRHVVARMPIPTGVALDRDDLCSAGSLGLLRAAETWDPGRGASFKTFAYTAIRGSVLDEIRRLDPVPRPRRDRLRAMERRSLDLRAELGRAPTIEELGVDLGLPADLLDEDLVILHTARRLSFDDQDPAGDDDGSPLGPSLVAVSTEPDPAGTAADHDLLEHLATAIAHLPERERHAIVLYHHEGLYLREIAELLEVTESRVCQILARATARLRLTLTED